VVLFLAIICWSSIGQCDDLSARIKLVEFFSWGHISMVLSNVDIDAEEPPWLEATVVCTDRPDRCLRRFAGMTDLEFSSLLSGLVNHGLRKLKGEEAILQQPPPGFCSIDAGASVLGVPWQRVPLLVSKNADENRSFFRYLEHSPVWGATRQALLEEVKPRVGSPRLRPRPFSIHGIRPGEAPELDSSWQPVTTRAGIAFDDVNSVYKRWAHEVTTWVDFDSRGRVELVRGPRLEVQGKIGLREPTTAAKAIRLLGRPSTGSVDADGSSILDYRDDGLRVIVHASGEIYCILSQTVDPWARNPDPIR
jgi:hypothetical protein